ncbi:hypothetical protein [Ancylobacter amanitiformis]|uniref:Uncharacterized protein n=1 Tax=Ancylobacter amanitiformis TaxID=217069 RepID=A0ABU0LWE9_9HYPH|nr:hypothetical protein [Ancylobacter amanitiformis]MDQ0513057.1 hypothetical protein [Ancylobacter amanitiformis]
MVITALSAAGCQNVSEFENHPPDRMRPIVGMTMAEFSRYTGLTPVDQYDIEGGRVFVLPLNDRAGPPRESGSARMAPDVCQLLLAARRVAQGENASSWRIEEVERSGLCGLSS